MDRKRYDLKETAKLIREALKAAFPDTKFSVRGDSYSMGCAIRVSYTDGPRTAAVNAITKRFHATSFDGMQDLKTYNKPILFRGELATFTGDSVHVSRELSPAVYEAAALRVHHETKLPLLEIKNGHQIVGGEVQVPFSYFEDSDVIAHGASQRIFGGEWYSQLVYQIARNTECPHKVGVPELPQYEQEAKQNEALVLAAIN